MTCLELSQIVKRFGTSKALDAVTLAFNAGEFVCVLGPSGCGKSTLLGILSGILAPDSGEVRFGGKNITPMPPERRDFGMVFQRYALFPNLTAGANIAYGLQGKKWDAASRKSRVEELLALVGLEQFKDRPPAALSGGQQQRVALARALAPRPQVLLLDEPLSALDAQVRSELGQELLRIQRATGITTIMVTHDQQEALALADRIVLMRAGKVEQTGTPEEIYAAPASGFAAEFVGHVNRLCLPDVLEGKEFAVRYEDVVVSLPSETLLSKADTFVGRVEHSALMGAFHRLEILLNNFTTRLYADVPRTEAAGVFSEGTIVAVGLPSDRLRRWDTW